MVIWCEPAVFRLVVPVYPLALFEKASGLALSNAVMIDIQWNCSKTYNHEARNTFSKLIQGPVMILNVPHVWGVNIAISGGCSITDIFL